MSNSNPAVPAPCSLTPSFPPSNFLHNHPPIQPYPNEQIPAARASFPFPSPDNQPTSGDPDVVRVSVVPSQYTTDAAGIHIIREFFPPDGVSSDGFAKIRRSNTSLRDLHELARDTAAKLTAAAKTHQEALEPHLHGDALTALRSLAAGDKVAGMSTFLAPNLRARYDFSKLVQHHLRSVLSAESSDPYSEAVYTDPLPTWAIDASSHEDEVDQAKALLIKLANLPDLFRGLRELCPDDSGDSRAISSGRWSTVPVSVVDSAATLTSNLQQVIHKVAKGKMDHWHWRPESKAPAPSESTAQIDA